MSVRSRKVAFDNTLRRGMRVGKENGWCSGQDTALSKADMYSKMNVHNTVSGLKYIQVHFNLQFAFAFSLILLFARRPPTCPYHQFAVFMRESR